MKDSFLPHSDSFQEWIISGYPDVKEETREFINNKINMDSGKYRLWKHQKVAILRAIYAFEALKKKSVLLNIVTGGGKTAVIGALIAWLYTTYNVRKFLILVPNLIVRDRLEKDFRNGDVFRNFNFLADATIGGLSLHLLQAGGNPQGMLESSIILGNIQQFYQSHITGQRNLSFLMTKIGDIALFNDEAHNTPAMEYSKVLATITPKSTFRLDTTATPDRADGQAPDSEMIYLYDIGDALEDKIVKSVVVYEPQVRLLELTYTNFETGEKRKITELDKEFKEAEKELKPFNWILDPEPMKKQIAIALERLEEQRRRAAGRYKPLLFVVTMGIEEAKRTQSMLINDFKIPTLLVTQESDEEERQRAATLGTFDSPYHAVVSVLMLREGWDVPEVSTILLLRKFSSPVYGQQVIGRGLRRIIRGEIEPEILAVVDHPRLEHDWLWRIVGVSKIRQGVLEGDKFGDEDLPEHPKIQKLTKPENFIVIPDPEYDTAIDFGKLGEKVKEDEVDQNWKESIQNAIYEKSAWIITRTKIEKVKSKRLIDKRLEELEGPTIDVGSSEEVIDRSAMEERLKSAISDLAQTLLEESGYGPLNKGKLYNVIMDHISRNILGGNTLSQSEDEDLEFVIYCLPQIRKTFNKGVVLGILGEK